MADIFSGVQWCSSPKALWSISYEYQRSGENMKYRFSWNVKMAYNTGWYGYGIELRLFLNGSQKTITVKGYDETKGWSKSGTTDWYTVSSKTSGTTPFYATLYDTTQTKTIKTSSTYQLAVSPYKATVSSATSFTDDDNPTITFSNPGGYELVPYVNFYNVDDENKLICGYTRTQGTYTSPYTFSLTEAERDEIRSKFKDKKEIAVWAGVYTYASDGTRVGWDSKRAICTITNANPTFTSSQISYSDGDTNVTKITGSSSVIVQGKSNVKVTVSEAKGNKGATISSYEITLNGVKETRTSAGTVEFGTINSTSTVSVKVIDSRGNYTTAKKSISVVPYKSPSVFAHPSYGLICKRCESNGDISPTGTYLKVCFKAEWSALSNNSNSPTVTVKTTSSSYNKSVELTPSIENGKAENNFRSYANIEQVIDVSMELTKTYEVVISCADKFGETTPLTFRIPTAETTFHLRENGMGAGFGMYATEEKVLAIADDWKVKFGGTIVGAMLGMGGVESVPNGTDFNTLVTAGARTVSSDNKSDTMSNIPINKAGILYVYSATGQTNPSTAEWGYVRQEYYPLITTEAYQFFVRTGWRTPSSGSFTFTKWSKFTGTQI